MVWVATPLYQKTFSGLITCFVMAVPFFRNTLFGDIFYVAIFFGVYELVYYLVRKKSAFALEKTKDI